MMLRLHRVEGLEPDHREAVLKRMRYMELAFEVSSDEDAWDLL